MLSKSGKIYDRTRVPSPFKTRQRFRSYQMQSVKSNKKIPKLYQTLDSNLRQKHDSYILRYAKETILNTNHKPNYSLIQEQLRSQKFDKGAVQRYIGDIRDEDYSIPLNKSCDHRCAKANNVFTKEKVDNQESLDASQIIQSITIASQPKKHRKITRKSQIKQFQPLQLSGKLQKSDVKSTSPSLIKKRSISALDHIEELHQNIQQKYKGVRFDSSVGHQYLKQVEDRKRKQKIPQFYNICDGKESIIRRSMNQPHVYIKFDKFRDVIALKKDRLDPVWFNELNTSNQPVQPKDLSYNFDLYSARQRLAVQSRYPHRQNMNFYIFPVKQNVI